MLKSYARVWVHLRRCQSTVKVSGKYFNRNVKLRTTAGLLEIENLSIGHFNLIKKLQTESAREMANLWGQLEQMEEERLVIGKTN